jgi:hypothetical protein
MKGALAVLAVGLAFASTANASIDVKSNGAAGDLVITSSTVIDLSQAITAPWDTAGLDPATAAKGIYDPEQWAVVFHYSSVDVQAGNVTFKNHPSRAPVVWLVESNVTINGAVNLSGQTGRQDLYLAWPGPGGFRGGKTHSPSDPWSSGFGPGGGVPANTGGSFATAYSNDRLVPLIGGSGGSGYGSSMFGYQGGGAGGGAILIAVNDTIRVSGSVAANGGPSPGTFSGAGSGGAIRIVADIVIGTGNHLQASRGGNNAEHGRIRIEANEVSAGFSSSPVFSREFVDPHPAVIWPEDIPTEDLPGAAAPTLRVVSIDGSPVPDEPKSLFHGLGDVLLATTESIEVIIEATHIPTDWNVVVRIVRRADESVEVAAVFDSGTVTESTWIATLAPGDIPADYAAIQARASQP